MQLTYKYRLKPTKHQFVARTRWDFQFKTAHKLFNKCEVLVVENFSLKNRSKRAPAKTDIGCISLLQISEKRAKMKKLVKL
jgi:putative transposase